MEWNAIQGGIRQWTGRARETWGRLIGDESSTFAGQREQFAGLLQERYGCSRDEADEKLDRFSRIMKS